MQKLKLLALASLIGLGLLFDSPAPLSAQERKVNTLVQCSIIDELDEHIQQRFLRADKAFGYARISPRTHISKFFPRDEEWATITDLQKSGWQVGFYLAGREVLGDKPPAQRWKVASIYHPLAPIKGALPITDNLHADDLPEAQSLWEQAKTALETLGKLDRYEFGDSKWTFSARPIRAQAECLHCHINDKNILGYPPTFLVDADRKSIPVSTLKAGDVLGVAIYAYRLKK